MRPMPGQTESGGQNRALFAAFLLLLVWLPLPLGSNRPWAWSVMEAWTFLLAAAYLWLWLSGRVGIPEPFKAALPVLLLLFFACLWLVLQTLPLPLSWLRSLSPVAASMYAALPDIAYAPLSLDPHLTAAALLKGVAYTLIFALTLLLADSHRRVKQLAYCLVFSGLLQAAYGSLMTLSGLEHGFFLEKIYNQGVATGTFVNRNHLAGYLEMCLAVGIGLLIAQLSTRPVNGWRAHARHWLRILLGPKARLRLYLVVMVIALILTHSRMGNTAFFASMMIAGVIGLMLSRHATRSTIVLLTSLIVIDTFLVGAWFGVEKVVDRIEQTQVKAQQNFLPEEGRDEIDIYALRLWNDYRWLGAGAGSFYSVFPRYRQHDVTAFFDHAHNDYLEIAGEQGLIGLALLGLAVAISLLAALRAQLRRRSTLMRGMAFAATMGIVSLLIHASVDFNFQIPANAATFMVLMALAWIALHLEHSLRSR